MTTKPIIAKIKRSRSLARTCAAVCSAFKAKAFKVHVFKERHSNAAAIFLSKFQAPVMTAAYPELHPCFLGSPTAHLPNADPLTLTTRPVNTTRHTCARVSCEMRPAASFTQGRGKRIMLLRSVLNSLTNARAPTVFWKLAWNHLPSSTAVSTASVVAEGWICEGLKTVAACSMFTLVTHSSFSHVHDRPSAAASFMGDVHMSMSALARIPFRKCAAIRNSLQTVRVPSHSESILLWTFQSRHIQYALSFSHAPETGWSLRRWAQCPAPLSACAHPSAKAKRSPFQRHLMERWTARLWSSPCSAGCSGHPTLSGQRAPCQRTC